MLREKYPVCDHAGLQAAFPGRELPAILGTAKRFSVYNVAYRLGLKKSGLFLREQRRRLAGTSENRIKTRFRKGHIPSNKGKKMEEWAGAETVEKFRANRFVKGHKPWNTKYDGAISVHTERNGKKYQLIRISENKWELLHRHVWMLHHGSIAKGYNIVFRDGNTMNCGIENPECISNEELMSRNTLHGYPPELQTAIKTKNKIIKKIKSCGKKQN